MCLIHSLRHSPFHAAVPREGCCCCYYCHYHQMHYYYCCYYWALASRPATPPRLPQCGGCPRI